MFGKREKLVCAADAAHTLLESLNQQAASHRSLLLKTMEEPAG